MQDFKKIIPRPIFLFFLPVYHWFLARLAAMIYVYPSRKLKVVGVTGTNGKTTLVHLLSAVLEEAGRKTASISSLRFKIGQEEKKNVLKMTMPGRFRIQKFLHDAVKSGCEYAVLEVTSEGIKQFRHLGVKFQLAILTNVTPEHIESHGSFEKYLASKAKLFKVSPIHVLNEEDGNIEFFKKIPSQRKIFYSSDTLPKDIILKLKGEFNKQNAAAAYAASRELGIGDDTIKKALENIQFIPGRLEFIKEEPFAVVVDYAHTPDALRKVYETLGENLICVLGAAGGGRDKWKRPQMGEIAARYCRKIILTDEDPYDEDSGSILKEIESGFSQLPNSEYYPINFKKISDRKTAIREALKSAIPGYTVIITGKGAEPWIMGPNGRKIHWDDREVAREELRNL